MVRISGTWAIMRYSAGSFSGFLPGFSSSTDSSFLPWGSSFGCEWRSKRLPLASLSHKSAMCFFSLLVSLGNCIDWEFTKMNVNSTRTIQNGNFCGSQKHQGLHNGIIGGKIAVRHSLTGFLERSKIPGLERYRNVSTLTYMCSNKNHVNVIISMKQSKRITSND